MAQSCPWASLASVIDALHATGGREDDAIELLVAAQNEPALAEEENADGNPRREHADARTKTNGLAASHEDPPADQAGGVRPSNGAGTQESNTRDIASNANATEGVRPAGASSSGGGAGEGKDGEGVAVGAAPNNDGGGRKHGKANGAPSSASAGAVTRAPKENKGVAKKVTRGSDCPCGSGLKYKKCCRKKDAAIARGQVAGPAEGSALGGGSGSIGDSAFADDLGALVI